MTTVSTRDAATGIRFTVERFESVMPELPPLFYEHWVEVAVDKDRIALDPDFNRYVALDRAGVLAMQTVRRDGQLKGYFISEVYPHLHYQKCLMAIQDIYYIHPNCRQGGCAAAFFRFVAADLKLRGVKKQLIMRKLHLDPRIGDLWERLGYRPDEVWYSKLL